VLTEELRTTWVAEHGPWLYWSLNNPRLWPWVLRDGIQPSDVTGRPGLLPGMESRPGHIYLMTDWIPRARIAAFVVGEPAVRVDMRALELDRFATDEDRMGATRALLDHAPEVKQLPGWSQLSRRPATTSAAQWMNDNSQVVDQAEWVCFSMSEYTVAYRGGIEIALLEVLPLYVRDDWEPADPGEEFVQPPPGTPAAHFTGPADKHPT
jgi:hypothetical protein